MNVVDSWTENHLRSWLYSRNPSGKPDEEIAEQMIGFLEQVDSEDFKYLTEAGWMRVYDAMISQSEAAK